MFFKKKEKERKLYIPIEWMQEHIKKLDGFSETCGKFDHIKVKNGRFVGYQKDEPEMFGTFILFPAVMIYPYVEK